VANKHINSEREINNRVKIAVTTPSYGHSRRLLHKYFVERIEHTCHTVHNEHYQCPITTVIWDEVAGENDGWCQVAVPAADFFSRSV